MKRGLFGSSVAGHPVLRASGDLVEFVSTLIDINARGQTWVRRECRLLKDFLNRGLRGWARITEAFYPRYPRNPRFPSFKRP